MTANPLQSPRAWQYRWKGAVGEWSDWMTVGIDPNDWTWPYYWTDFESRPIFASTPAPSGLAGEAVAKPLESIIYVAISDPGIRCGMKGERTLTQWQTDSVMAALASTAPPSIPAGGVREALEPFAKLADEIDVLRHEDDSTCLHRIAASDLRRARDTLASLSLPAGGVAVSDAWHARHWHGEIEAIGAMLGIGAPEAGEVPAAVQELLSKQSQALWRKTLDAERVAPDDGGCVRCSAVPRTASGLCNTCMDEDAERAGELDYEDCGNVSATDTRLDEIARLRFDLRACRGRAEIDRQNLRHWREECGKINAQVLTAKDQRNAYQKKAHQLDEALRGVLASLVALTSIVIRAEDEKKPPSKVVASDAMFVQMLKDYDAATIKAREALKVGEPR